MCHVVTYLTLLIGKNVEIMLRIKLLNNMVDCSNLKQNNTPK